jgi:hypothetical protein
MKLYIKRDQSQGFRGRIEFDLTVRFGLTDDEAELVNKYKIEKETLLEIKMGERAFDVTVADFMTGHIFKHDSITEILECEKNVRGACEHLKNSLEAMKSFGGEEVVDYN